MNRRFHDALSIRPHCCLLLESDPTQEARTRDYLQRFNVGVSTAHDWPSMQRHLGTQPCDVVVLDCALPDFDYLQACQWLHRSTHTPLIVTTPPDGLDRGIAGLLEGADDYLRKPIHLRELVARIRAVLRRSQAQQARSLPPAMAQPVRLPGWRFDGALHTLIADDGSLVSLTLNECKMLRAFIERPRQVITRHMLAECIGLGFEARNGRSIDLTVSRLRKKLGDRGRTPPLLITVHGEGYALDTDVSLDGSSSVGLIR